MTQQTPEQQAADRFARETAQHEMTVLHDDGLYRHIRCMRPESSLYHFDLVTWPRHLAISGDLDGYTFRCADDMFDFFRRSSYNNGPNPSYWDEKVTAGRRNIMTYHEETLTSLVADHLKTAEGRWPGVIADWEEKTDGFLAEYDLTDEDSARYALRDYEYQPDDAPGEPFRFGQELVYETSFQGYDWSFLWSCHAIVLGIGQYDAARKLAERRAGAGGVR